MMMLHLVKTSARATVQRASGAVCGGQSRRVAQRTAAAAAAAASTTAGGGVVRAAPASRPMMSSAVRTAQSLLRAAASRQLSSSSAASSGPSASVLNTAIATGDLAEAERLVAGGADVNLGDYDGRTPLHVAASFNNVKMARFLASKGAVMREDRDSRLPIHDAIQYHNVEMQEILNSCAYEHEHDFSDTFNPELVSTVFDQAARHGLFTVDSLREKLRYFVGDMGLGGDYFDFFSHQEVAEHFHSFTAACITARTSRNNENICVESAGENDMVIIFTDCNKLSVQEKAEQYMMATPKGMGVNLRYMRSRQAAIAGASQTLNVYHIQRSRYVDGTPVHDEAKVSSVFAADATSTENFKQHADADRVERVNQLLQASEGKPYAIMQATNLNDEEGKPVTEVNFAVPTGSVANDALFLRSISDTFLRLGHHSQGGGIDKFSNGTAVYTLRCSAQDMDAKALAELESYANLAFTQFRSPLFDKYAHGEMSGRQLLYFHAACRFTHYFEYERNEDLVDLYQSFKDSPMLLDRVSSLDKSLGTNLHTLAELYNCVLKHPKITEELYADFARRMTGDLPGYNYPKIGALLDKVGDKKERHMLRTFGLFNESVTSTNLWKKTKSAAAFRMDPKVFLKDHHIPEIPFAIFMVLGLDFTGFHVRFRDISRGGVRLIKSTPESYETNRKSQFLENFNLAYTQKLKNKDIPESGSKGTILLKQGKNDRDFLAFQQYVDSILDITIKAEGVTDLYKQPEYIFLGPDEHTAGFMDGACEYAKSRNYDVWRAFTTGKSPQLGGIPHDTYGMTTRSVRSFTKGIMRRLGLKEEECTKFITGGPDGDLGSNEIAMGREVVVGVVDGSGVLYDPHGINDEALKALARPGVRKPVEHFDQSLLSSDGFFVHEQGRDQKLPTGEVVRNGVDFRNNFHVWDGLEADFFVPCGGRPESIHKGNVARILKNDGKPRFKYIVEGANLFITESARNFLQDKGVLLFKDASTNKGGVTSSSLEVLAGLSMTDEEFSEHMQADAEGNVPEFYARYVEQVIQAVEANATAEFDFIFDEVKKSGRRSTEITRLLSEEMNNLNDMITHSDLFESDNLRHEVLRRSIPSTLQDQVGLENIMQRVPVAYQRAIFAMYLSSRFVYENGSDNSTYNFYKFMQRFQASL